MLQAPASSNGIDFAQDVAVLGDVGFNGPLIIEWLRISEAQKMKEEIWIKDDRSVDVDVVSETVLLRDLVQSLLEEPDGPAPI